MLLTHTKRGRIRSKASLDTRWRVEPRENISPKHNADGNTVNDCAYDYMGRRFEKKVTANGTATATGDVDQSPRGIGGGLDTSQEVPEGRTANGVAVSQPIQWSSEYHDTELDLIYYNYRYYNPADGRWTRRDPIEITFSLNVYSYTDNDTLNSLDLLGLKKCHRRVILTHYGDYKSDKIGARDNVLKPGDIASGYYGGDMPKARDKWVLPYGQKVRIYPDGGTPFDGQVADVGRYDKKINKKKKGQVIAPEDWLDVWDPEKSRKNITEKGCVEVFLKDGCPCPNTYEEGGCT